MTMMTTTKIDSPSVIFMFPGQGSQKKGMGQGLFERYPRLTNEADQILGFSIKALCLEDPHDQLGKTQFTQPALFVVNSLSCLAKIEETGQKPDFVAGHSLGEYNALFAAGVFDFAAGLRLAQKRGELMSRVQGGGMVAVLGMPAERVSELLFNFAFDEIDLANYNSPTQTVVSGPQDEINDIVPLLKEAGASVFPLKVSGAFHSRMMAPAQQEFAAFLRTVEFAPLKIPVISNCLARPYENDSAKETLSRQITSPVRWTESIQFLLRQPNPVFQEVGPGNVLTRLVQQIESESLSSA